MTFGIGAQFECLSWVIVSGEAFSYRMHYLLKFCDVIGSIATLTAVTVVLVSGTLSVRDKSLGVEALVRTKS